jgi:YgiT-type zinc finger domain-containing protein
MMICIICKQAELQEGTGSSLFERDGMTLVIKGVPKLICPNCGEEYTDEETTERLLQIVEEAEENGVLTDVRQYKVA